MFFVVVMDGKITRGNPIISPVGGIRSINLCVHCNKVFIFQKVYGGDGCRNRDLNGYVVRRGLADPTVLGPRPVSYTANYNDCGANNSRYCESFAADEFSSAQDGHVERSILMFWNFWREGALNTTWLIYE